MIEMVCVDEWGIRWVRYRREGLKGMIRSENGCSINVIRRWMYIMMWERIWEKSIRGYVRDLLRGSKMKFWDGEGMR